MKASLRDGVNAVHFVSQYSNLDIDQYMVEMCQIDVETRGHQGASALHHASWNGQLAKVQFLVEKYMVNVRTRYPLFWSQRTSLCQPGRSHGHCAILGGNMTGQCGCDRQQGSQHTVLCPL
jgi:hypothetical protein